MDRAMLEQYIKRQVKKVKQKSSAEATEEQAPKKVEYASLENHEKRKFVKVEEQQNKIKVAVRFFQLKKPVTQQHSFIVGVEMGGLSQEISTIVEIKRSATFKQLRVTIEEKKDRGMVRRTITFQALRHFMEMCSNPHNYPEKRKRTEYRLGIMESEEATEPTLLSPAQEEELSLMSIPIYDSYRTIVLIPVSQICPVTDQITWDVFESPKDQLVLEDQKDSTEIQVETKDGGAIVPSNSGTL